MVLPPLSRCPDGLPELRAGAHLTPEDGACLMEYVSVLTEIAFSDHPRCTDPALAELARLVNDNSTDAGRPRLASLAPALAATPPTDAVATAAVVCAALCAAQDAAGRTAALARHLRRGERRLARVSGDGLLSGFARATDLLHRHGPARRRLLAAVTAVHALPAPERDTALRTVLCAGIHAASGRWSRGLRHPAVPPAGEEVVDGTRAPAVS
jgi:hypothetical protein